ncbi:MAG: type II toxin-antitoxin system RelE/ParE family toxin [Clostridium sp.]
MQYKIEILPSALEDLKSIQDYYCINFSKESALTVTESILDSIERLKDFPSMGSILKFDDYIREMNYRMVLSKGYASIYRVIENTVYIYHIVNTVTEYKNLFYSLS